MIHYIIVSTPAYVTLFWAIVLLAGVKTHKKARLMLGVFMAMAAILYSCHAIFFLNQYKTYLLVDSLYLFTSLSVYPLYYWYVKLLTIEKDLQAINLLHFIPALVLAVSHGLLHITASFDDQMLYLNDVLIGNRWELLSHPGNPGWLARIYLASRLIFAVQVTLYALFGFLLANRYDKRLENYYSDLENRRLAWVKLISISLLLVSLASMVFNIVGRGAFIESETRLIIPSVIFSILLFTIGLQGNKQNAVIREMGTEEEEPEEEKLTARSHEILKKRLEELMIRDRIYLVPDLKITTLCKLLNTNRTYISNVINEETGGNFNTYINRFRIEYAVGLMKKHGSSLMVINYIAQESGFGSSSSFIRAFKSIMGMTPGKYLQENQSDQS